MRQMIKQEDGTWASLEEPSVEKPKPKSRKLLDDWEELRAIGPEAEKYC